MKIPVIAIIDSNSNPDGVNFPVPGNDDAGRAITLYCDLIARAAIDGIERAQGVAGIDIGEAAEVSEAALDELPAEPATNGKAGEHHHAAPAKPVKAKAKPAAGTAKPAVETAKPASETAKPASETVTSASDAETLALEGLAEPQGEKDDLKKIRGITRANEKKLNERGIFHFWQIAAFTQDNLDEIDRLLHGNGQIAKGDWVDQARELTS